MEDLIFEHWGAFEFKPELFKPISQHWSQRKPSGGLWSSPIDSNNKWTDFNDSANVRTYEENQFFKFKLCSTAKVLILSRRGDFDDLPVLNINRYPNEIRSKIKNDKLYFKMFTAIDFKALANIYDAILLTTEGEYSATYFMNHNFWGWDCETLLVFNKEKIITLN